MEKSENNSSSTNPYLFQIGKAAKLMNVTRKMILNYEACGLLVPDLKVESSGYRYYSADNLTQIGMIRILQDLGLSIPEIKEYINDNLKLNSTIERLERLRNQLNSSIVKLKARANSSDKPDICWTILPKQTMFCQKLYSNNLAERTAKLREAYIAAACSYGIKSNASMFMDFSIEDESDCLLCIPVPDDSKGENIQVFPDTHAICIYHRGPYEAIPKVRDRIFNFLKDKDFKTIGVTRSIYIEGPPNRGADNANYITQVAVPVYDSFDTIPHN